MAEATVRLRPPAPVHRGRSSSAERSLDMREAKRAALFVPTILEGIAQPARADASHASGQRCNSFCPPHLLSLWCSPANMPASHAGDHRSEAGQGRQFLGAWLAGNSRPTWLRTRQPWTSPAAIFCVSTPARRIQVREVMAGRVRRKTQAQWTFGRTGGDQPL